jgi:hypothetical protein
MPPENGGGGGDGAAAPGGRPPRGPPEHAPPADGGSPGAECSSVTAEMRETWMLLEYCDRGNLDRAILNRVFVRDGKANLARARRAAAPPSPAACSRQAARRARNAGPPRVRAASAPPGRAGGGPWRTRLPRPAGGARRAARAG